MKRRRKRRARGNFILRALVVAAVFIAGWLAFKVLTWPNVAALARENPKSTAFMERYERRHRGDRKAPKLRWTWVPWNSISSNLKRAVVVAEDAEFFFHDGFSEREIKAAIEKAVARRELPRGASTITQQLAKNLWLTPSRNPLRKAEEALLTRQLEEQLTKRRILEIYLNVAEFGPGIYGAEAASRTYFKKSAAGLNVREAAALAASLPKPSTWHPGSKSRYYNRRTNRVERMVARSGFLRRFVGGTTSEELAMNGGSREPERVPQSTNEADSRRGFPNVAEPRSSPSVPAEPDRLIPLSPPPEIREAIGETDTTTHLEELMRELREDMEEMRAEENLPELDEPDTLR